VLTTRQCADYFCYLHVRQKKPLKKFLSLLVAFRTAPSPCKHFLSYKKCLNVFDQPSYTLDLFSKTLNSSVDWTCGKFPVRLSVQEVFSLPSEASKKLRPSLHRPNNPEDSNVKRKVVTAQCSSQSFVDSARVDIVEQRAVCVELTALTSNRLQSPTSFGSFGIIKFNKQL